MTAVTPVTRLEGFRLCILVGTVHRLPQESSVAVQDTTDRRDYPMLHGLILAFRLPTLVTNLLTDLSCAWLDPRISYARKGA